MERRSLRSDDFVVMRPQTVEHGVAEFMIDDVGREASVDTPLSLSNQ